MIRLIHFISICLLMVMFSSCGQVSNKLENMIRQENNDYVSIIWEGRTYVPFCAVDNSQRWHRLV